VYCPAVGISPVLIAGFRSQDGHDDRLASKALKTLEEKARRRRGETASRAIGTTNRTA
jgi:hypothetical protein